MFNLNYLELFILNTIIYFDLFDYPLTLNEIYTYLFIGGMEGSTYTLIEIEECLANSSKLKKFITTKRGFYFLKNPPSHKATADGDGEEIIQTRLERYNLADKKFQLALRTAKLLKFLPFIKLIAVCNNLAYSNARPESDIDLFIITAKNRIWLVRFWAVIIITLLGLRPPKTKVKDKICLSFYLTEEDLDLNKIKVGAEDIYLVFWLATLWPVYERDNFYQKLIEANSWLKKYLPNWQPVLPGLRRRVEDNWLNQFIYQIKEFFCHGFLGNWLTSFFKQIQLKFMSQNKKDLAVAEDKSVIITDTILKFHENDRRAEYQERFERKRQELAEKL
ncbi:MAG: hypothetical protein A2Y82_01105 [Candidatus Buchananbacteria bacterium RBG_13_36_9]|uniref:Polymerase nucleotidyl transferase domain-containing protein n=1 Tax=Candidatus Buchananbacteria bacterium RBG_13_36_9 TaxID=1797530 RepID=A0A1G1XN93_9BACT|nr:MAG: hypothetical protein A2Y82_01105 [Candidatus Buchananbacteria bacterium RBG_13_36_9]